MPRISRRDLLCRLLVSTTVSTLILLGLRFAARQEYYPWHIPGQLVVLNKLSKSITLFDLQQGNELSEIYFSGIPHFILPQERNATQLFVYGYHSKLPMGQLRRNEPLQFPIKRADLVWSASNTNDYVSVPTTGEIWHLQHNRIEIKEIESNRIAKVIPLSDKPRHIQLSTDADHIFVTSPEAGVVWVFDTHDRICKHTIEFPGKEGWLDRFLFHTPRPSNIVFHPNGKLAFVSNSNADKVAVIELSKFTIVGVINTGRVPDAMALILPSKNEFVDTK